MLRLDSVNKKIAERGIKAELVKGDGYFYFVGDDLGLEYTSSVMVNRINQLTLDQWMEELDAMLAEHKERLSMQG